MILKPFDNNRRQLGGLPVVRRHVAGVDLGSEWHWVCAPTQDGSDREIASFGATTSELMRLAEWLKARQVESVAMESTGIYWIAPPEVLEGQGLQVLLVDTRQLARVPGRDKKTDPTDCDRAVCQGLVGSSSTCVGLEGPQESAFAIPLRNCFEAFRKPLYLLKVATAQPQVVGDEVVQPTSTLQEWRT